MTNLRVGVLGVGHHGRHHARLFSSMPNVELVGVVDADRQTALLAAEQFRTKAYSDVRDLVSRVDAVSVVVPTTQHYSIAERFLRRGIATFVEKPLALDVEQARMMVHLARENHAVLQVGHIERFNPAWLAVEQARPDPWFIHAERRSKFPFRSLDVSVVFDVMIHDIELALSLVDSPIARVEAVGRSLLAPTVDQAEAWVTFENDVRCFFVASRVHHEPVRRMSIQTPTESHEVDFMKRTHVRCRPTQLATQTTPFARPIRQPNWEDFFQATTVEHDKQIEPLKLELEHFVQCAMTGQKPKVSGQAGYEAVLVAHMIHDRLQAGQVPVGLRASA